MNVATMSAANVTSETSKEILQMVSVVADGLSSPLMAAIISFMEAKVPSPNALHNTHFRVFFGGIQP